MADNREAHQATTALRVPKASRAPDVRSCELAQEFLRLRVPTTTGFGYQWDQMSVRQTARVLVVQFVAMTALCRVAGNPRSSSDKASIVA